jgi:hypothetical protein
VNRGAATTSARADHTHALAALPLATTFPPQLWSGLAGVTGVSTSVARADHSHGITPMVVSAGAAIVGTLPSNLGDLRWLTQNVVTTVMNDGSNDIMVATGWTNGIAAYTAASIDWEADNNTTLYLRCWYSNASTLRFHCVLADVGAQRTRALDPNSLIRVGISCLGW